MPGRPPLPAAGLAYVGLAEVAYQRNELDSALRHVTEGIALCRQFVYTPPLATRPGDTGVDPAGRRRSGRGTGGDRARPSRPRRARPACSTRSRRSGPGCCWPRATWPQPRAGRRRPASAPTTSRTTRASRDIWCWPGSCWPRTGPAEALALLDRLHAAAAAQDRVGSLIEIGALRALALAASGEEAGAVAALAEALTLACPQGYVRVFADEGPPMAALLGRLIAAQRAGQAAAGVPLGCLARLQRAFDARHTAAGSGTGRPPRRCGAWSSR